MIDDLIVDDSSSVVVGVLAWAMNTKQVEWFRMVLLWTGYIICKERKAELVQQ